MRNLKEAMAEFKTKMKEMFAETDTIGMDEMEMFVLFMELSKGIDTLYDDVENLKLKMENNEKEKA
jgi:selenocysteine-specific translation elongation factor